MIKLRSAVAIAAATFIVGNCTGASGTVGIQSVNNALNAARPISAGIESRVQSGDMPAGVPIPKASDLVSAVYSDGNLLLGYDTSGKGEKPNLISVADALAKEETVYTSKPYQYLVDDGAGNFTTYINMGNGWEKRR